MKIKDIINEGEVVQGKFGKGATNSSVEIPQGYESFYVKKVSDTVAAIYGVKKDGKEVKISTGHAKLMDALAKEYNAGGKAGTGIQQISMTKAFGSEQLGVLDDAGIKLVEKPFYWEDVDQANAQEKYKPITEVMFKKVQRELKKSGHELKVYSGKEIFGSDKRPEHCQVHAKFPKEPMFVVQFSDSKYLCDTTGARSYIRNWALIK
jgi:hypothetical protein